MPDEGDEAPRPRIAARVALVAESSDEIANDNAVAALVDAVAADDSECEVERRRQVAHRSEMELVRVDAPAPSSCSAEHGPRGGCGLGKTHLPAVGHTDNVGSEPYHQTLAGGGSGAVTDYLRSKGVIPQRLVSMGQGENSPRATNATEEGRRLNRRVEIVLTAVKPPVETTPVSPDAVAPPAP